jgi:CheY-like chemotaxis protein
MIWVVDDHADTAELVVSILKRRGLEAEAFPGAAPVLQSLAHSKPDLLILDMMMPEIDGIEFLRRLRDMEGGSKVPVIVYSADFTQQRMQEAIDLGASAYFVKGTVGFNTILQAVGRLTHHLN